MHKYLKKFKFNEETCVFNTKEKDKCGRQKRFNKQRKKYGFDERETWSLDFTMSTWLYCHLKRYLAVAERVILLEDSYCTYEIPVLREKTKDEIKYSDGSSYPRSYFKEKIIKVTLKEAIEWIILYLEKYLMWDNLYPTYTDNFIVADIKRREYQQQAFKILPIIIGSLWW